MGAQYMEPRFGVIEGGEVGLSFAGEMVAWVWQKNLKRYPGAALDPIVVMPDHVHAIVFLGTDQSISAEDARRTQIVQSLIFGEDRIYPGRQAGQLSPYDRMLWQRGFHNQILRNDRELEQARIYIESNPARAQEKLDSSMGGPYLQGRTLIAWMLRTLASFMISDTAICPPLGKSGRNSSACIRSSTSGLLPGHVAGVAHFPLPDAYTQVGEFECTM